LPRGQAAWAIAQDPFLGLGRFSHVTVEGRSMNHPEQNVRTSPEGQARFRIEALEERIAPSSANFPPGQFPSGNPAHAPGQSNPNEVPATNPSND
jgi:hypothetical protein